MLAEFVYSVISGFLCAWLAVAAVSMGKYHNIFGRLKYRLIKAFASQAEIELAEDILTDEALSAGEQNEKLSAEVYWYVAKKSRVVYFLLCSYCQAVWFHICSLVLYNWIYEPSSVIYLALMLLVGISVIYFSLNFVE